MIRKQIARYCIFRAFGTRVVLQSTPVMVQRCVYRKCMVGVQGGKKVSLYTRIFFRVNIDFIVCGNF